jgi:hypothetical protein
MWEAEGDSEPAAFRETKSAASPWGRRRLFPPLRPGFRDGCRSEAPRGVEGYRANHRKRRFVPRGLSTEEPEAASIPLRGHLGRPSAHCNIQSLDGFVSAALRVTASTWQKTPLSLLTMMARFGAFSMSGAPTRFLRRPVPAAASYSRLRPMAAPFIHVKLLRTCQVSNGQFRRRLLLYRRCLVRSPKLVCLAGPKTRARPSEMPGNIGQPDQ